VPLVQQAAELCQLGIELGRQLVGDALGSETEAPDQRGAAAAGRDRWRPAVTRESWPSSSAPTTAMTASTRALGSTSGSGSLALTSALRQAADGAQHPLFHHQIQRILEEGREETRAEGPGPALLFAGAEQETAGVGGFFREVQRPRRHDFWVAVGQVPVVFPGAKAEVLVG
jgi:hypothetical protein